MVLTVSFVISPVIGLCCHRRFASAQNLTPASRRQDHTTSPSAFSTVRQRCLRSVHRIPPRVRDDRERPSVGRDGAIKQVFCLGRKRNYFLDRGWTDRNSLICIRNFGAGRKRPIPADHYSAASLAPLLRGFRTLASTGSRNFPV